MRPLGNVSMEHISAQQVSPHQRHLMPGLSLEAAGELAVEQHRVTTAGGRSHLQITSSTGAGVGDRRSISRAMAAPSSAGPGGGSKAGTIALPSGGTKWPSSSASTSSALSVR